MGPVGPVRLVHRVPDALVLEEGVGVVRAGAHVGDVPLRRVGDAGTARVGGRGRGRPPSSSLSGGLLREQREQQRGRWAHHGADEVASGGLRAQGGGAGRGPARYTAYWRPKPQCDGGARNRRGARFRSAEIGESDWRGRERLAERESWSDAG